MSNNPPGLPRFNALTRAMDLVSQYNQTYTPRAFGGQGVPDSEFVEKPQEVPLQQPPMQPPFPQQQPISPEEAQRRLALWAAESGQVLDPTSGNIVARVQPQAPVMPAPYGSNPGVRRMPEYGVPGLSVPPQYQQPFGPPQVQQFFQPQAPVAAPRMSIANPMSIQSIQSIDFDRGVVWADGTPFPFDLREAQPVLQFALEIILRQFAVQFGSLLQRYGFVQGPQGVQSVQGGTVAGGVPQGQQQGLGAQELLQGVSRGDAASVPQQRAVPESVPPADASGSADGTGGSSEAS